MSSGGSNGSNIYQYGQSGAADTGVTSGASALTGAGQQAQNLYSSSLGGLSSLAGGTNYSNQSGVDAGNAITNNTNALGLTGAAQGALSAGANANSGLYSQELQQTNDQTNAALASRGIATTPYGAGVQSLADQTFNNNFNTQQVGLENTAANTASTLLGAQNQGTALGAATSQSAADNPLSALSSLLGSSSSSTGQLQSAITDYLAYLSGGTSASSAQSTAANQNAQVQNSSLSGLGSLLGIGASFF